MPPFARSMESRWSRMPSPPAPDTPAGMVLVVAMGLAVVYLLVLLSDQTRLNSLALWVSSIALLSSLIGAFSLGTMLGGDIANYQRLELDLSRTVIAYVGSGSAPASDAPLAGVWRAYVGAAEESRRMARAHAYALGFFLLAGFCALPATLIVGLGTIGFSQGMLTFGMFVNWFAFGFLVAAAGTVLLTVGYSNPVPGFERIAARRWRRNSGRQQAVEGALSEVSWLGEFVRSARESYVHTAGPSVVPSWREA